MPWLSDRQRRRVEAVGILPMVVAVESLDRFTLAIALYRNPNYCKKKNVCPLYRQPRLLNDDRFIGKIVPVSGGTDGEDGPAGAFFDDELIERLRNRMRNDPTFDPQQFLETNNAYHFFKTLDGLVTTGPTGTNVCDLRALVKGQGGWEQGFRRFPAPCSPLPFPFP